MANEIDIIAGKQAIEGLNQLIERLDVADKLLVKAAQDALDFNRNASKATTPSGLSSNNSINASQTSEIQKQAQQIKILSEQMTRLLEAKNKMNNATAQEKVDARILLQEETAQAKAISSLTGSYQKLDYQHKRAIKNAQNLGVTFGRNSQEFKEAAIYANRFDVELKKIDDDLGKSQRNVGNYKSAFNGLGSALASFGVIGGVAGVVALGKNIFETTKELQSLNMALKQVSETEAELASNQLFLSQISESYGVDLKDLTKQFTQFYVSAKDKLGGSEIKNIFESITKAGASMGLSTQQQERAFLALNQMMSKGTIQAEELRGQLGESLPGALGIMAKSLGVTEAELGKLMKDGKLISSEVLPKFAIELEKVYGIDTLNRIETLSASQSRLSNSWTLFIDSLNNGGGKLSKFFGDALDYLNGVVKLITEINATPLKSKERFDEGTARGQAELEIQINEIKKSGLQTDLEIIETAKLKSKSAGESIKALDWERNALIEYGKEQAKIMANERKNSPVGFAYKTAYQQAKKEVEATNKQIADLADKQGFYNGIVIATNELLKGNSKETKVNTELTKEQIKAIEDLAKARYDAAKRELEFKIFQQQNILDNDLTSYKNQYDALQKSLALKLMLLQLDYREQVRLAKGNSDKIRVAELDRQTAIIKQEQEGFNKLKSIRKAETESQLNEIKTVKEASDEYYNDKEKKAKEAQEIEIKTSLASFQLIDKQIEKQKELNKATKEWLNSFSTEFLQNSGFGSLETFFDGTFDKLLEGAESTSEKFAVYFNAIAESAQEAFNFISEASQKNFDGEKQRVQSQYDVALKYAGDNKEAQAKLADDLEKKKKEIANREAKAKKRQAMANIAIDTAQALISLWASPGFPGAIPLSLVVAGVGAAQLAYVAGQEIPQFFTGGVHDGGMMLVNDGGGSNFKETIRYPDGKIHQPTSRNVLMDAPSGTEIFTHDQWNEELNRMMSDNGIRMSNNYHSTGMTKDEMYEVMNNTLGNQPQHRTNFDANGVYDYIDKRGNRTKQNTARANGRGQIF